MLEETISVEDINRKLAESELTPFQIDQIRHQEVVDLEKKANLKKGFEPQLSDLLKTLSNPENRFTPKTLATLKSAIKKDPELIEADTYNPIVLDFLFPAGSQDPRQNDDRLPMEDLPKILKKLAEDKGGIVSHLNSRVIDRKVTKSEPITDIGRLVVEVGNYPNLLLQIGVYDKISQAGSDNLDSMINNFTKRELRGDPQAKIFEIKAFPKAKLHIK